MKLIHTGYNLDVEIRENQVTVLSVENPKAYTTLLQDIWSQTQGGEGGFILSEGEEVKSISKVMECVFNPFAIDCNDKRIITKLYQELKEQSNESMLYEGLNLNAQIVSYIEELLNRVPYSLELNVDFDLVNLLKMYGVKVQSYGESLIEKIIEYLRVMNQVCNLQNYVFVGLKQYLETAELEQLYEFAFYEKVNLVIIESMHSPHVKGEKCWLLDKDLCIIDL